MDRKALLGKGDEIADAEINQYSLNITRALGKKLEATNRNQRCEYKFTEDGIVITADTATFELIKIATLQYFEKYSEHKESVNIRNITDKSASTVVQYTIHVNLQGESYTVNIYTTTSRLLVNGKRADIFLNNDILAIHQLIQNGLDKNCPKGSTIKEINTW